MFFGALAIVKDEQVLNNNCPHIVVRTPRRILALIRTKKLPLKNLKHFVLDECDNMLEQLGMLYLSKTRTKFPCLSFHDFSGNMFAKSTQVHTSLYLSLQVKSVN